MKPEPETILVIGMGNPFRGDDAVGLLVADGAAEACPGIRVIRHTADGTGLLEAWNGYDTVVVADAVVSGSPPGTVHVLDGLSGLERDWFATSTHAVNLAEAVELGRALGRLPPRLIVIGIEGNEFRLGEPVSAVVCKAVNDAIARLVEITGR